MARQLTDKQQALLNVLFEEAGGDMVQARNWRDMLTLLVLQKLLKVLKKKYLRRLKCTWHVMHRRLR